MSRRFGTRIPLNRVHLFPSAIVCSCGKRFDSDCTATASSGSALWLYLRHKASAIASSTKTKPHRLACTIVACAFCSQSVGVNHYRAHLAQCQCAGGDAERLAIADRYRQLDRSTQFASPSFECALCLDEDRFQSLDIGAMLAHRHRADALLAMELYVKCRVCASDVAVDNALGHAAFAHRERLETVANCVADMFFSAPQMRPLPRCFGDPRDSVDDFSPIDHDKAAAFAPDRNPQSFGLNQRPQPLINGSTAREPPVADSIADDYSRTLFNVTISDYLSEEIFSEPMVESLCDISTEPTNASPPHLDSDAKCSPSSQIVTSIRRERALRSARRPTHTAARSETVQKSSLECGQSFVKRENLAAHQRKHAIGLRNRQALQYECDNCGLRCSTALNLQRHGETHTGVAQNTRQRMFECDECGITFSNGDILRQHRSIHSCERAFVCLHCEKHFFDAARFNIHRRIHSDERPFACSDCGKRFLSSAVLKNHRRIHTGERPFACSDCGKRFLSSAVLKNHRRIHTGERPFACSDCGRRFTQSSSLSTHLLVHTGERPFICSLCKKRFISSGDLRRHRRVHTGERPYACSDCSKRFVGSSDLQRHRLVHTGERPYACSDCSKRFVGSSDLQRHRRVHTGERRFACSECAMRFTRSDCLSMHRRRAHTS